MALGGYKFAGYKVTKPEGATNAEWALLIHKTRLKAFMAANTLAGEIWEFDRSNGDVAFETYGNVIYYADRTDPLNLVSFFKHSTEDKYYAIVSAFNYFISSSSAGFSGYVRFSPQAGMYAYYTTSSNYHKIYEKQLFHVVSYDRFDEDFLLDSANNYPTRSLGLVPITNFKTSQSTANIVSISAGSEYGYETTLRFGYALRDKDILTVSINGTDLSSRELFKVSLVGFDSMTLSSPDDEANIYGIVLGIDASSTNINNWTSTGSPFSYCQNTLKDNFERYEQSGLWSGMSLSWSQKAIFAGSPQAFPFESVTLKALNDRVQAPFLNGDGISSKGTFDISLLSANSAAPYTLVSAMQTYANGNYLLALQRRANGNNQTNYYVGWDPSNPDVTNDSSWTAYTE